MINHKSLWAFLPFPYIQCWNNAPSFLISKLISMHRVIVPIDFSETSMNAARFTAQMLTGKKDATVILYHNYKHKQDHDNCFNYLESLKQEFLSKGVSNVECENEMGGDLV